MAASLRIRLRLTAIVVGVAAVLAACGTREAVLSNEPAKDGRTMSDNPVHYFEIPVTDMERAVAFYSAVFGYKFERTVVDGYEMALFPRADSVHGASGALAKGDVYVPSITGSIIYFSVGDIDVVLERAKARGAEVLYPKKAIGVQGFVAEIRDSEGNRIALHALAE